MHEDAILKNENRRKQSTKLSKRSTKEMGVQKQKMERHIKKAHNRKPKLMENNQNHNQRKEENQIPTHQGTRRPLENSTNFTFPCGCHIGPFLKRTNFSFNLIPHLPRLNMKNAKICI